MSYTIFIDKFIHPFILYVLLGTLFGYLLIWLFKRLPILKNSKIRALVYGLIFVAPIIAYGIYRPYIDRCTIYGHPLGEINDALCQVGNLLATILTPLFFLVTLLAIIKAALSIYATHRIITRYGYAEPSNYPELFTVVHYLAEKAGIKVPKIIVTGDDFGRSFTMGYYSPVIVLSKAILEALDKDELETVLAHELAHIVRGDSLTTWVTVFLRDFMFFAPIVFLIFRDLSCEKEMASDDFAITLTGKPMAFAQALIKVWRMSPRSLFGNLVLDNYMPHPNFVSYSGILELRVKRILNNEHMQNHQPIAGLISALVISMLLIGLLYWVC